MIQMWNIELHRTEMRFINWGLNSKCEIKKIENWKFIEKSPLVLNLSGQNSAWYSKIFGDEDKIFGKKTIFLEFRLQVEITKINCKYSLINYIRFNVSYHRERRCLLFSSHRARTQLYHISVFFRVMRFCNWQRCFGYHFQTFIRWLIEYLLTHL